MKFLANSTETIVFIKKIIPNAEVILLPKEGLKKLKQSEIDCIFLLYPSIPAEDTHMNILPLLRRFAAEIPEAPVFIFDNQFSLSHHNDVTNFPNVIAYGQIDHSVTNKELNHLLENLKKRESTKEKIASLSQNEIRKTGWCIQINKETDFKNEYSDKLYLGEMRTFINNLKAIIDKIRPKEFIPDYTANRPLLDWLEMWHAHKHGATHYPDPNSDLKKLIDKKEIEDAKKIFETKRANPNIQHILIRGETGVGKTFIANFIHNYYYRTCKKGWYKESPTIVSCPEIQGNLAVPTLFGCLTGAWTDSRTRVGYLLESYNGTLFLDEIGAASSGIQEKLLRYLDYQNFRPDGWSLQKGIYVPLLVVAATNQPMEKMMEESTFREDLYFRFLEIKIPPFRSCKDYLEIYIDCELQNSRTNDGSIDSITTDAIEALKNYDYPGNFREFHRILGVSVQEAKLMRVKTIMKEHIESALKQIGTIL